MLHPALLAILLVYFHLVGRGLKSVRLAQVANRPRIIRKLTSHETRHSSRRPIAMRLALPLWHPHATLTLLPPPGRADGVGVAIVLSVASSVIRATRIRIFDQKSLVHCRHDG